MVSDNLHVEHVDRGDGRWRSVAGSGPGTGVLWVTTGQGSTRTSSRPGLWALWAVTGTSAGGVALVTSGELGPAAFGLALVALAGWLLRSMVVAREMLLAAYGDVGAVVAPSRKGGPAPGAGRYVVQLVHLEVDGRTAAVAAYREVLRCDEMGSATAAAHECAAGEHPVEQGARRWNAVQVLDEVTGTVVLDLDLVE